MDLLARLVDADPASLSRDEQLDALAAWEQVTAWVEAQKVALLATVAGPEPDEDDDWVREEVACALTLSPAAADRRITAARALATRLTASRDALAVGALTPLQAMVLVEETTVLGAEACRLVEKAVLDQAAELTPGRFRGLVRRAVVAADPDGAAERSALARETRAVQHWAEPDGMATMTATMGAESIRAIWDAVTAVAERWADGRTLDQRRADALYALVTGSEAAPQVQLQVTVDLPTLVGLADEPATLHGFGPLPPELVRVLAGDAIWQRWVTDPLTGELLDQGRTAYRPSRGMRRFVEGRDRRCRFPGCTRPARRSDLDHREPWEEGGPTDRDNLVPLCRRHHRLKTFTRWRYRRLPDGTVEWTDPLGRTYRDPPQRE